MIFNLTNIEAEKDTYPDGEEIFFGTAYTNNAERCFEFELTAAEYTAAKTFEATGALPDGFQDVTFEVW